MNETNTRGLLSRPVCFYVDENSFLEEEEEFKTL